MKNILNKIEFILLFISLSLLFLLQLEKISVYNVVSAHFYILVSLLINNWIKYKRFTLFQFWIVAFIYMILSEMLIKIVDENDINIFADSISYLLFANDSVLLGYCFYLRNSNKRKKQFEFTSTNKQFFSLFFLILYVISVFNGSIEVLKTIAGGRQLDDALGSGSLFNYLLRGVELALPPLIGYHFKYVLKRSNLVSFIIVLPIFILQLLQGTRFVLLYSLIPYLVIIGVINFKHRSSIKKNVLLFFICILLIKLSSFVKEFRNNSLSDILLMDQEQTEQNDDPFPTKISRKLSPEGIVNMTNLSFDYFSTNPHSYGKEVSFIFYFWVPRSMWNEKPTPISYWLIRKYAVVVDQGSTSSGFCGELQADFGNFSFFLLFLLGIFLKKADIFIKESFSTSGDYPKIIIAAIIVPYVFFIVRSPITASTTFITDFVICYLYIYLFYSKKRI